MVHILFVDDDPNVLQALQRMLRPMRHEWQMFFVQTAIEALEGLSRLHFDVVVSDMHMPGMGGIALFQEVKRKHPHVIRIALSGHTSLETNLSIIGVTHQHLAKPCDSDMLRDVLTRACALRDLLQAPPLPELVLQLGTLPSFPLYHSQIMDALRSDDASIQKIGEIIAKDMAMSAKIMQMANSSYFGSSRYVSDIATAVSLLGFECIQALALSHDFFSTFPREILHYVGLEDLWAHSTRTGSLAKRIAELENANKKTCDAAFTAGFMHDVGKLILACNLPDDYSKAILMARQRNIPIWQAEYAVFGATHADVGAYLLGAWGLSNTIVDAVAWHHKPDTYPGDTFGAVTAVHAANALDRLHCGAKPEGSRRHSDLLDMRYIEKLGLGPRIAIWRERIQ